MIWKNQTGHVRTLAELSDRPLRTDSPFEMKILEHAVRGDVERAREIIQKHFPGASDTFQGLFANREDMEAVERDFDALSARLHGLIGSQPNNVEAEFAVLDELSEIRRFRGVTVALIERLLQSKRSIDALAAEMEHVHTSEFAGAFI